MAKLTWPRPSWGMLLALVPFLIVVLARWSEPPAANDGDYAQYLLHAKALVEGRPYSDIGYIYTRLNFVGPPNQPPGWPLVLAPLVFVFGVASPVFKVLMTALVASFAVVAGFYFARRSGPGVGFTVAAITALSLQTQGASASPISDPLFCLLVWLTLSVAAHDSEWTWRRSLAVAALSLATASVRVAGVALVPALLLYSLFTLRERRLRVAMLIGGAVAAALVALVVVDISIPFLERVRLSDKFSARQVEHMIATYRTSFLTGTLYPFATDRWNDIYHVAVVPFVLIGAFRFLRTEGKTPVAFFALTYIGLLWIAPVRESRYAWPLVPILVYCLALGWLSVIGFVARVVSTPTLVRNVSLVAVSALCVASAVVHLRTPRLPSLQGNPDATEVFDYVRDMASSTPVRIVFENPRVLTLTTGVPAMGVPNGSDSVLVAALRATNITHVVIRSGRMTGYGEENFQRLVIAHPTEFPLLLRNGTFTVHEVRDLDAIRTDSARAVPDGSRR